MEPSFEWRIQSGDGQELGILAGFNVDSAVEHLNRNIANGQLL